MLTITFTTDNELLLVKLEGRFDGSGGIEFDKTVSVLPFNQYPVLDFENVQYLSSAGIRSIIAFEKKLRKENGRLILISVPSFVKQVLEITGILSQLLVAETINDAESVINNLKGKDEIVVSKKVDGCEYIVQKNSNTEGELLVWNQENGKQFIPVNLSELSISIGTGSLATTCSEAEASAGDFISFGNFFGLNPKNDSPGFDYILSEAPSDTHVFIKEGISLPKEYNFSAKIKSESTIELKTILKNLFALIPQHSNTNGVMPFVISGNIIEGDDKKSLFAAGFAVDEFTAKNLSLPDILGRKLNESKTEEKIAFAANGLFFNTTIVYNGKDNLTLLLKSTLEKSEPAELKVLAGGCRFTDAVILVYHPVDIIAAESKRLKIEFEKDQPLKDEFEIIIRKIYSDCSSILVKPLHGGYSAQTFMVDGYDHDRKRIIPTVLKLGNLAMIKRERDRYEEFVKKYILNNSVSILGSYFHGDWGGVRYNFVGINGPESKLKWLTLHYKERPVEEYLKLLKKVFTEVLLPWYGQPRLEIIYPYKEHDPTAVFFKHIYNEAEKNVGVSAEKESIFIPALNRNVVNPYWYLKYKYKEKEKYSKLWYKCISHGDLNMQNILVDEIENIYIIDFSETKVRNAVSDFARIEPIVKNENVRLESEDDLRELLKFEEGLLIQNNLDEEPVFTYSGNDPMVEKAFKTICVIRKYAKTVTLFENDIIPYLLAVLEWTLPIVCYFGVDNLRKQYSMYTSALMCEKIEALEANKK